MKRESIFVLMCVGDIIIHNIEHMSTSTYVNEKVRVYPADEENETTERERETREERLLQK